jgi:hypothetical protein
LILTCRSVRVGLLLVAAILSQQTASWESTSKGNALSEVTVCELMQRPSQFKSKLVRVRAWVQSDLIHNTALVDDSCESKGISLWIPHERDEQSDVRELRAALSHQWKPGEAKTRIAGVFTGIFLREAKKFLLKVSKADGLRIIQQ